MKNIIYILGLFLAISCGSLKKTKESTSENSEINSNTNTVLNYEKDSYTLEPVNLERPILVGGKEYHNTKIIVQKEVGKEEKQEKKQEVKEVETKKTDKEKDNTKLLLGFFGLFLVFIIIVLVIAFYLISKKITAVTNLITKL